MTASDLNGVVLVATLVLLAGVVAVRISTRAGLPSLLLYLAIGLGLGEAGLGIAFEDADLTMILGSLALAIILAEGGLTTRWAVIRPVVGVSVVLATVGVAVSVTATAGLAWLALDIDVRTAVLLGAVVSSTDAAAVFAVMRTLPLRGRLRATLEAESGFNDPPVIILVTVVTSTAWNESSPLSVAAMMLYQLVTGALVGLVIARAGQWLLTRSALPSAGLYPLATIAIAMLAFAAAGLAGASPFLAVYVAALWLGNAALPHRNATQGFADGLAWLAQIGLFVMLGLLASPSRLIDAFVPALIVGGGLLLIARPLSVVLCATPFRIPWREQAFMSWAGLRGAVPIVLATIPITVGLPSAERIFDVVFLLVVVFTLIQGPTLPAAAQLLGVGEPDTTREVTIESAPLENIDASLLQFQVPQRSKLAGVSITELRLPANAVVSLIQRDDTILVPSGATTLRTGDNLLIAAADSTRAAVENRLRAVSRAGRLAGWNGEHGDPGPPRHTATAAPGGPATTATTPQEVTRHTAPPSQRRPAHHRSDATPADVDTSPTDA